MAGDDPAVVITSGGAVGDAAAACADAQRVLELGPGTGHFDGSGKADLFRRAAAALVPGGRLVVADVVVPEDPADAVTPLDAGFDLPSTLAEQLQVAHRRRTAATGGMGAP